ncbi:hypothetical protein QE152_g21565 [Popillia japonica]|uniref:Uncharacterized protein n=1 Tax=Popillia japonica TaxID=7064 RepID=A0AAW1KP18_POPJA
MAESNFDYEEYLKQFANNDYVLEDIEDNSSTFEYLFESVINQSTEKKQSLQKLIEKKTTQEVDLNSEKKLLFALQERKLEMDEAINRQITKIAALEMERDETVKNYMKTIDNLYNRLSVIEDEFDPDSLKQQIIDLKRMEEEFKIDIKEAIKQKNELEEHMHKLDKDVPDFRVLLQIRNEIFDNSDELGKRKRELENVNKFISDLKSKLDDSRK